MSKLQDLINSLMGAAPNFGAGMARGVTADVLGGPVDTLNAVRQGLLMPAQAGNPVAREIGGLLGPVQQTGTSDYFAQQMGLPEGQGMAYEAGRMLSPSPGDLMSLARRAPSIQELITYHGTPHRFEPTPANPLGEFRASQIGTGEGAQMYGHGIYLAEAPDVAKQYADNVKDMGAIKDINARLSQLASEMDKYRGAEYGKFIDPRGYELKAQYDALMDSRSGVSQAPGNLYTADLPDEMIDKMLDWDKPLSEQSKEVKEKISDYIKTLKPEYIKGAMGERRYYDPGARIAYALRGLEGDNMTGEQFYQSLGYSKEAASKTLKEFGLSGIKYLDQGSRKEGKGTRNFVVFPGEEKKVKILKRN
tara:strand:+ start:162 stop:1250 length:1089 start_codon:yes stop_codon:yes gene_type:complete